MEDKKPKLHYPNGRGRMETIRWVLAAAGVEFEEEFLETKEQLQKLQDGNHLLFQQVPMVEIDGMKLVQTRSILHYIADKHNLFGRDLQERTLIDMYVEGTLDLLELIIMHPFLRPDDQQKEVVSMAQKAIFRYFPVFEKEYSVKVSNVPTIRKFLEPGSKKKPPPDEIYVRTVYNIFMPS
uniref:glutathione transferase n=1 Tax=Pipistrellus kuhlii TaxID=59472 RepID=A0A7J7YLQ7_PIPKU|nr:glutathione S-transferase alpha 4 [Pipistrellus kuhlii]